MLYIFLKIKKSKLVQSQPKMLDFDHQYHEFLYPQLEVWRFCLFYNLKLFWPKHLVAAKTNSFIPSNTITSFLFFTYSAFVNECFISQPYISLRS
jgi:hypothetical protein